MDSERTSSRWVDLPEAVPVKFGDLPILIANALHDGPVRRAAAVINLEDELRDMVKAGTLQVRDPLTHGRHPCPDGAALQRAVLLPSEDVRPLLEARGIGVRLIPYGTGPTHWTIENAAAAIAAQEGWHNEARDTLRDQMMQAARDGTLTVRHPHTDLKYRPEVGRDYCELVTRADVNAWLALDEGSALRWDDEKAAAPAAAEPALALTEPKQSKARAAPLVTPAIADAFDGIDGLSAMQWRGKLGDLNNHQWLLPALAARGKAPSPSTWWPLKLADLLQGRGVTLDSLNRLFLKAPALRPWLPEWQESKHERNAFGQ